VIVELSDLRGTAAWSVFICLISFLPAGSGHEARIAESYSILVDTPQEFSELSFSVFSHSRAAQPGLAGTYWVSPNLGIFGALQPFSSTGDLVLYLNTGLSYLPENILLKQYSTTLGFGMHRMRFGDSGDYRYFNLQISGSIPAKHYDIKFDWQRLFDTNWQVNQFHIYLMKKLARGVFLQVGTDIPTNLNTRLHPLMILSAAL